MSREDEGALEVALMCIQGYDRSLAVASVRDRGTSGHITATLDLGLMIQATLEATSRSESCSSSYDFQKE